MRKHNWNDIKHIDTSITKIDASDPSNLSNVVVGEREYRKNLLTMARNLGCERDMLKIFAKYDGLLKNCSDQKEREDIGKLGVFEVYSLLERGGKLYVNGALVYDDEK